MIRKPRIWFIIAAVYIPMQPYLLFWLQRTAWEKQLAANPTLMGDCSGVSNIIALLIFVYAFLFALLSLVLALVTKKLSDVAASVLIYVIYGIAVLPLTIRNIIEWMNP